MDETFSGLGLIPESFTLDSQFEPKWHCGCGHEYIFTGACNVILIVGLGLVRLRAGSGLLRFDHFGVDYLWAYSGLLIVGRLGLVLVLEWLKAGKQCLCLQGKEKSGGSWFRKEADTVSELSQQERQRGAERESISRLPEYTFTPYGGNNNSDITMTIPLWLRIISSTIIPSEILELSKLETLDASFNNNLELQKLGLKSLVEKLSHLKVLFLDKVNISSSVPDILTNLSSLTALSLRECELQGEFPAKIFQLPNLHILSVRYNPSLSGYLLEFEMNSPLEDLRLVGTRFSGEIPYLIGNLSSLLLLDISNCSFFRINSIFTW
ncbi:hypothetical protein Pint_14554 [Pistacia integerrima]|uniref:Uncharacterized protein n=1 Tax=Pistacia integerrima TaxID=434235 RepID=A0ACC0Y6J6_9ROSI|nr:hypothetical protein Pint_14554 [Pistacia integerrima]